jgi:glycosyltransferase involved in cell wall biosynthesis
LTQTQVVAYLEGVARAGHRPVLLTFEPRALARDEASRWREMLRAKGVAWHWVRYHKRPTVPATAWDILVGVVTGLWLAVRYRARLVHARSHVPGVMALALKRLTGAKLLFDIRGFMAEEYVDGGVWPAGGRLFRATKRVERRLVRAADGIIVLTEKARGLLEQWYPVETRNKVIRVIPCCVDLRHAPRQAPAPEAHGRPVTLVYVGKLGGWYLTEEMARLAGSAARLFPDFRWQVWTQSDPAALERLVEANGLRGRVRIGKLPPERVSSELVNATAAVSLIKPCLSKLSSSPTKVAEYLAAGLPVVSTAGIGDVDELLLGPGDGRRGPVGVLLRDFSEDGRRLALNQLRELLHEPDIAQRCRAVAEQELDLERVGWVRYQAIYDQLARV